MESILEKIFYYFIERMVVCRGSHNLMFPSNHIGGPGIVYMRMMTGRGDPRLDIASNEQ
jgi:hypothetical protein